VNAGVERSFGIHLYTIIAQVVVVTMRSRGRTVADVGTDRGVSELAGYVLLVGIVIAGAATIFTIGAPLMDNQQDHQDDATTELSMQEVQSRLASLSESGGTAATEFSLLEDNQQVHNEPDLVTDRGSLNVTVNGNSSCSVNVPLDSIRVETETGDVLAYEAGGIWRQSGDGGVATVTKPSVSIRDGHVDLSLANLTGSVSGGSTQALFNASTSTVDSRTAVETLTQGDCKRPDNVTIEIRSDFYRGWADHLGSETGYEILDSNPANGHSNLTVEDGTDTTRVFLNQSALPPETNDAVNNVVDLTNASYMSNVTVSQSGIAVSKNASNNYTVYVEPVADDVDIGTMRNVSASDNVTRDPLDVVFVVDESGSMGDPGPSGTEKRESVRGAIRNFTTYLDSDIDRVGLVGFQEVPDNHDPDSVKNPDPTGRFPYPHPNYGRTYRTNDVMLTDDFETFNDTYGGTVENLQADGWTYTAGGMKKATSLLDLRSNETRDQIIVMLSDGKNNHGHEKDWWVAGNEYESGETYNYNGTVYSGSEETGTNFATIKLAEHAQNTGVTTYTVGFGSPTAIPDYFLKDVADAGGGWYNYTSNQDELQEAFELIAQRVASTQQIGRTPFSTNLSANGSVQSPQITGNVSNLANVTKSNKTFLNVNDPTAPSTFSHAFSVSEGGMVNFSATVYGCDEWATTGRSRTINGSKYPVTRCKTMNASKNTTVSGNNVTVYTNDNSTAFSNMLANTTTADWQTNMTDLVANRSLYNKTTNRLTLESNQALVLYDFPDGKNTDNKMLVLYTIGLNDETRPANVVDISISNVELRRN